MFLLSSIFFAWVYVKARDSNQDQVRTRPARIQPTWQRHDSDLHGKNIGSAALTGEARPGR
jgi:hypothetical protein